MNKKFKFIKYFLVIAVFFILFKFVDFNSIYSSFKKLSFKTICLLMSISFFLVLISSYKWKIINDGTSKTKISLLKYYSLYLIGYFVNLLMPSYLGGDAVRSVYLGRDTGQVKAFSSTIIERYSGLVAMLFIALVVMPFTSIIDINTKRFVILISLAVFLLSFLLFSNNLLKIFSLLKIPKKYISKFEKVQSSMIIFGESKKLMFYTFLLSLVFHIFTMVNVVACGYAIGWNTFEFFDILVVLPMILLIGAVPITPSGLGVTEGAFMFYLTKIGATPDQALSIALILRAKTYILAIFGAIILLKLKKKNEDN